MDPVLDTARRTLDQAGAWDNTDPETPPVEWCRRVTRLDHTARQLAAALEHARADAERRIAALRAELDQANAARRDAQAEARALRERNTQLENQLDAFQDQD
ncbi:hypothetical protein [Streptomyces sp. DH37]|uniref:hypothetical protein n=1 Tax=Streptomyces sp. DH37 TaxID=3040122 RepID=UPI00244217BD|nr:hypothetical protein [Streptomyces sp. DH37]MDG9701686.1 hypothetical protein [Streptomyces sp. DH37]